jgi:hypothetical protein
LLRPGLGLNGRRRCGFPSRKQRERVHVAVRIGGQANAEVEVGLRPLSLAARADRAHDLAFLNRGPGAHSDRAEVDERDRVAIGGANRQAQALTGQLPDERGDACRRSPDLRTRRGRDVDSPVLAACVGISFGDERA